MRINQTSGTEQVNPVPWLKGIIINAIGSFVGIYLVLIVFIFVLFATEDFPYYEGILTIVRVVGFAVGGIIFGYVIGIAQGFVIQTYKKNIREWILISTVGWGLSMSAAIYLVEMLVPGDPLWQNAETVFIIIGPLGGSVTGFAHWAILRKQIFGLNWWVITSALGWSMGWIVAIQFMRLDSFAGFSSVGMIGGVATGAALMGVMMKKNYKSN